MDEHIGDPWVALLNRAFYLVCDVMPFPNRNVAIDFDMEVDVETQAHFADEALIDFNDAGNRRCRLADTIDNGATRSGIKNFVKRWPQQPHADASNYETNENCGPIIGAPPF